MAPSGKIVINISSDEEEEHSNKRGGRGRSDLKQQIKKELDDDCVILDGDPNKPLRVVENESGSVSDELVIVAEKGQVACRDYPHARHLCARFPFNTNPHEKYCALCHCYVCDTLAPCDYWGRGMSSDDHCHATDKEEIWRALRECSKKGKGAQLPALNNPVNTPSNASILHPTTGPSRPMSGGEGRAVTVGLMVTAFDQLTVQTDRLTGTVKWFDCLKGYGFITPDSGGEDLFVHHSSIKSAGYRSLAEGEAVEFRIERRDDGRKAAIEVTGLGMSFVQDTTTRDSDLIGSCECYKCGETGHLARNCVVCYNCGKTGHLARNCSCTGGETDGNDSDGSDAGRYNNCSDTRKCYICGQTGHLTRNCVRCYNCGKTGHFARNCSYTGSPTGSNDFDGSGTGRYNFCSVTCKCYVCREAGHLAKDCSHMRNGSDANDGGDIGRDSLCTDSHQNNCGEMWHFARSCSYTGNESDNNDTQRGNYMIDTRDCYNCGKTGHLARNCPNMGSESDDKEDNTGSDTRRGNYHSDTRKCYICGQTGHLTRNCVRCYDCGKTGHFARNCSYMGSPTGSNDFDGSGTGRYNYCSVTCKCYVCRETGHLAKDCSHTRNGSDANDGGDIGPDDLCTDSYQNNCGGTWHFARNRSYMGSESDNNDTQRGNHMIDTRDCYNCGKTGHLARNCPNIGSESDDKEDNTGSDTRRGNYHSDTRECYNCGRTGHLARNCSFSECRSSDTDNNDSDTSEGDQLVVQAEILTGTVMWFSNEKGYGFITPDGGGEDLFVHQSSIKSKGYRSLAQGEVVEFQIERGDDGRKKAVDVTGPGGSFVQGTARRDNHITDNFEFYSCGRTGHLARNCSYTGSSSNGEGAVMVTSTGTILYL